MNYGAGVGDETERGRALNMAREGSRRSYLVAVFLLFP